MRERAYLRTRYGAMLGWLGLVLVLAGALTLIPLTLLFANPGETRHAPIFLLTGLGQVLLGLGLRYRFRHYRELTLSSSEGGVIVLVAWLWVMVLAALPFMAIEGLNFSQAFFESVSAWTTTGLSVVDVEHAGALVLFWRSLVQWAGGAGLAIIMMSALVGPTGVGISNAEGRADQLVPQVRKSARIVLAIYSGYAVLGTLAYCLVGLTPFEAVNHAFAAISTGGFSTRSASIGAWDSAAVEAVTLPLMLLGNLSFVTAWYLIQGKLATVAKNGEVRVMAVLIPLATGLVLVLTCIGLYPTLSKAARVALFEVVSALTTTGFSSVPYSNWNGFGVMALIALMLVGGGTCSTAGGLKQFRIHLLWREALWELRQAVRPGRAVMARTLWEGERLVTVDGARVRQLSAFVFLYLAIFTIGSLILCGCGYDLQSSLFEFASSLGTVGLSIGVTSPNMPLVAMWTETIGMILGRLELFVIFASLFKMAADLRIAASRERGLGRRQGRLVGVGREVKDFV